MNKKIIFIGFSLLILSIPIYLMISSENVLENGYRHKIQLQAYDPFDPFRGKYLRLNYDNTVRCDYNMEKGDNIYISLEKDSLGYSFFSYGSAEAPKDSDDYFETRIKRMSLGLATFETDNISKYFINEDKATKAETIVQRYQRDNPNQIYVAIRILDGEIRLEDIYIEETPLLDFMAK